MVLEKIRSNVLELRNLGIYPTQVTISSRVYLQIENSLPKNADTMRIIEQALGCSVVVEPMGIMYHVA